MNPLRRFLTAALVPFFALPALLPLPAQAAAAKALTITTTTLPAAEIASAYTATVQVTGGKSPYTWSVTGGTLPSGLSLSLSTGVISGTPTADAVGDTITVNVTDSSLVAQNKTVSLALLVYPQLLNTTQPLPAAKQSTAYSTGLTAIGGKTPYTWALANKTTLPAGLTLNASTGVISGTPTTQGTFVFSIKLSDAANYAVTTAFSITVRSSLTVTSNPTLTPAMTTRAYSWSLAASGGKSPYKWFLPPGSTLPTGLALTTSSGVISGTPSVDGNFTFSVQVTDNNGYTAVLPCSLAIAKNLAITTSALSTGMATATYPELTLAATGGTGTVTWSVSGGTLPAGLTLTSQGLLSGTPSTAGSTALTLRAVDGNGFAATKAYTLVVNPTLTVTTSSLKHAAASSAYSGTTLAATGGNSSYSWTLKSGTLPDGITLNSDGTWSGTPTTAGTSNITVQVTDGNGYTATADLSLVVDGALSVTTSSLADGTQAVTYVGAALVATGGDGTYSWSVSSGTLPSGITLNSDGTWSGAPSASGTSSFTVQVTDGNGYTATAGLSISVDATLTVTTTSLANGTEAVTYAGTALTATGGSGTYSWIVLSGSLPDGITLNSDGTWSGTPTTAGTPIFTVQVTDGKGNTATASLSITIEAAPIP